MATYYPEDDSWATDSLIVDLHNRVNELESKNKKLNIALVQKSAEFSGEKEEVLRLKARVKDLEDQFCVRRLATAMPGYDEGKKMFSQKAVFLDRDGTLVEIIERPDHPKKRTAPFKESEIKFVDNVYPSLTRLKECGFLRVMVTNQPDVAHGYLEEKEWQKIQRKIEDTLGLHTVYMCRHRSEDDCARKKPSPRMLIDAHDNLGIDLLQSWMVGDSLKDMQAGRAAGCRVVLISWEYNMDLKDSEYDHRAGSLMEAVDFIIGCKKQA